MPSSPLDYDRPSVLNRLFYPRPQTGPINVAGEELRIPVAEGVELGAHFFPGAADQPTVLFFHGNGEIVADYAEIGPYLAEQGAALLAVDYRGYGCSGGQPSVATMLDDCQVVFDFAAEWVAQRGLPRRLVVMGRSLGSASAVELAATRGADEVAGLIVESGFARAKPLLRTLGVRETELKQLHSDRLENVKKIVHYTGPTLVIHGALDHLIPVSDGQALYEASPAAYKDLLVVPRADHNSLFHYALEAYLAAVARLLIQADAAAASG